MTSNNGTITAATKHLVMWAHPNMLQEQGDAAVNQTVYNTLSYYAFNLTLIVGLVIGVVAPLLKFISITAAAWWVVVPLAMRFLIFKELTQMEACGDRELDKCLYLIARIFGGLFPEATNNKQVLQKLGLDLDKNTTWKVVNYQFLGIEVRSPLPSRFTVSPAQVQENEQKAKA
jgi:hypothetical protein